MWRNLSKQASLRKLKFSRFPPDSNFPEKIRHPEAQIQVNSAYPVAGFRRIGGSFSGKDETGMCNFAYSSNPFGFSGFCNYYSKGYASVAEAIASTEEEDVDEVQELIEEMNKINKAESNFRQAKQPKLVGGMGQGKYHILRRRQIKMETEAWEDAAKEYQELLMDMCEQKLAPNLPYMKSLFLGWFEPLRDVITAEQELWKEGKNRAAYAPYIDHLPADMMAVITMHKLMGLLMTGGGHGSARVVQAACQIGEAIEHEVRIHRFLEKTKKKNAPNKNHEEGSDPVSKEQQILRKKVTTLMKKQKLLQVREIVKGQDDSKPWGQDAQVKVGCRLIQLLMETAYIQPPVDQLGDGPPDIRPAFVHTLKTVTKETQKCSRRYGVIECDPLVRKGLERTARHMVIPYMPMLVPPLSWTGYDRGAYLFLPSYIMRTHGAKQQRDTVKRAPKKQLEPVFEALNTLGNTKWSVNKRVLSVVDRIWASGGGLADLVDREDVPLPEEPDTEDEAETRKWKWKVKAVKKRE
uniref:DNA-directed RNA polymerase N-terminal domain-containing protein n=1 Tax=Davidia involucrata TaxID=16924 RepID=A0A5B6YJ87_DAVIN